MIPGQWDLKLVLRPKSSAPSPCPLSSSSLPSVSVDQGRCLCDLAFITALALDAYIECYTTWPGLDFTHGRFVCSFLGVPPLLPFILGRIKAPYSPCCHVPITISDAWLSYQGLLDQMPLWDTDFVDQILPSSTHSQLYPIAYCEVPPCSRPLT